MPPVTNYNPFDDNGAGVGSAAGVGVLDPLNSNNRAEQISPPSQSRKVVNRVGEIEKGKYTNPIDS